MKELLHIQEAGKVFEKSGVIPFGTPMTYAALLEALSVRLNSMILNEFSSLVQLLYTMDIAEEKLKSALREHDNENAGKVIAAMMIERQLEKIRTREMFRKDHDIAEEDRW